MKLFDLIKGVGAEIVKEVVPGGGLIIQAVNEFLPEEDKLSQESTGEDIGRAVSNLPPDKQAELLEKEFDVEITKVKEENATVRSMFAADATDPQTTRPKIAWGAFQVVAFSNITVIALWSLGILKGDPEMIKAVVGGWAFVASVILPMTGLLARYFGILRDEHRNKLSTSAGVAPMSGVVSLIKSFRNK